jgi:hypothetical protein
MMIDGEGGDGGRAGSLSESSSTIGGSGCMTLGGCRFWFSGTSGTSGTLVFWYFVKLGFHFPGDLATEKVR